MANRYICLEITAALNISLSLLGTAIYKPQLIHNTSDSTLNSFLPRAFIKYLLYRHTILGVPLVPRNLSPNNYETLF